MIIPVILCGGSGSRLWPMSREALAKQFISVTDANQTLFQATAQRCDSDNWAEPVIVTSEDGRFMAREQLAEVNIQAQKIILEPARRNTAPALAAAALLLQEQPDALLLVLPADHIIQNVADFQNYVEQASAAANAGHIVTFGISPTAAETGYGYIKRGAETAEHGSYPVQEFVEKPLLATAEQYLASGDYLWNSGMFLLRVDTLLAELQQYEPAVIEAMTTAVAAAETDMEFVRLATDAYTSCKDISIDYAVLERTATAAVLPVALQWSDVGSWAALAEIGTADSDGNVFSGDVISCNTHNTLVRSEHRLVATVGIENAVIVETDDAVLVASKDHAQDVKTIVNGLKSQARTEAFQHKKVYRPWGWYESIGSYERSQVKRIMVKPGEQLSLQMHHHRAEHWIVINGTAKVTCGDNVFLLAENESTYIPIGQKHRLENPGKVSLEIIEVQSGSYLGEDDIVRFEDNYGRAE